MKPLAAALAVLIAVAAFAESVPAQTAAPAPTSAPWRPRPVIIIDPHPYLASPTPRPTTKRRGTPRPHATPVHRRPLVRPTAETFNRLDTSPPPAIPYRAS